MNLIVRFAFASLILPSMDADHLDIYGTSEAIESLNLHLKLKTKAIFYNKKIATRRRNLCR
jgi:UDP-N-acetylmuramate-alanine ligase